MTKEEYLKAPCRASSLPYWKTVGMKLPKGFRIVHGDDFTPKLLEKYEDDAYFRLFCDLKNVRTPVLPDGFAVSVATPEDFAAHIGRCYDDIGVTAAALRSCQDWPVYCPALWLAVVDQKSGEIVASGIGELDRELGEGILEWIQVSPGYRGRHLGSFVVLELLRRMEGLARFATVSGRVNNPSNPERLYRSCGFTGSDVWHILRRKETL